MDKLEKLMNKVFTEINEIDELRKDNMLCGYLNRRLKINELY